MLKRFCLALFFLTALTGCGNKEYEEAVVGKKFVPRHVYINPTIIGDVIIPMTETVPDSWFLYTENHKERVSKKFYDVAEIGDTLAVTKETIVIKKYERN